MTNNELTHHGIVGQKWGKKNGPPYPLNSSQKSSAEKQQTKLAEQKKNNSETAESC